MKHTIEIRHAILTSDGHHASCINIIKTALHLKMLNYDAVKCTT